MLKIPICFAMMATVACGTAATSGDGGGPPGTDGMSSPDGMSTPPPLTGFLADGGASCLGAGLGAALGHQHLMIGFAGDDAVASQAPFDVRYVYLSGGYASGAGPCASCAMSCDVAGKSCANSAGGCAWWGCYQYDQNPPGEYVRDFVSNAAKAGEVPMFTYYEILQASGVQEGTAEATQAANNATFMARYYADFRFMLKQIGNAPALVHVEPDFWGYAEQANVDPHLTAAAVASANAGDCGSLENSIAGFGQCLVKMTRTYAPNAKIGLHASAWSTNMDVLLNTSASLDVVGEAKKTAKFLAAAGGDQMDFVVVDYSDRDTGYYKSMGRNTAWNENATLPNFTQALAWTQAIGEAINKPVVVWQIPVGNSQMNDTCDHYKDNRVDYLMNHADDVARAHVALLAFGAGAGCQTTPSSDNGNLVAKTKALAAAGGQSSCP